MLAFEQWALCKEARRSRSATLWPSAGLLAPACRSAARGVGGRAIQELKQRRFVVGGQQVAIVQSGRQPIWRAASTHGIQVRMVDRDPEPAEE